MAAIPAGFLPVAYTVLAAHALIATVTGADITPEPGDLLWWMGTVAIWLTIAQWPFYLLWVTISPELTMRQKVAWGVVIFIGNMFAMPYFLFCKYRNTTASVMSIKPEKPTLRAEIIKSIHSALIFFGLAFGLLYFMWQNMLWKSEALIASEFAAKLWAANDFDNGKVVKLRLTVAKDALGSSPPLRVDGPYVIRELVGYADPLLKRTNSPSVQAAHTMVDVYNSRMKEIVEDPEKYRIRRNKEIAYWQTNVLGRQNASNQFLEAIANPGRVHSASK